MSINLGCYISELGHHYLTNSIDVNAESIKDYHISRYNISYKTGNLKMKKLKKNMNTSR